MKNFTKCFILLSAFLLITSLVHRAYSQERGNLSGKVSDKSGNTLPGASVTVQGTTLGTSTDINGFYTLRGVQGGPQKIVVQYLGYQSVTVSVDIVTGKTINLDFKLTETAITMGTVVVSAVIDGQQRALNQQRAADNMMQVVSADQMGRFPDLNVAEALQRLSGVTISRSRGEGAEVQLRGTPANFVNINVNGEQMMGADEGGKRNASLDVIPSDILASMEVQKTLLPSNDGDAIAGVINMRTAIARSLKARGSIDLGSGYNVLRERAPYNVKAGYSQRFAENKDNPEGRFGIAANFSYFNTYNGYDRLESQVWLPKNIVDKNGNSIESLKNVYVPTDFRYRYQEGTRVRKGGTLALDYAPNLNTRFILSGMYNNRQDEDTRYRNRYRYRGAFYDMGDGKIGTDRIQNVIQTTYQNMAINNFNINLDGETTLGTWKIDGGTFYSQIKKNGINAQYGFQTPDWRSNNRDIAGTDNGSGSPLRIPNRTVIAEMPSYTSRFLSSNYLYVPSFGGAADDPSRFNFYTVDNGDNVSTGQNVTARFNVSKSYFISEKYASTFSFGAKGKFMHNERYRPESATISDIAVITNPNSPDYKDTQFSNFLHKANLSSKFMDGNLSFGPSANIDAIRSFIANRPDRFVLDQYRTALSYDMNYYNARENVASGYLMNRTQFNKLMAIVGVRIENTSVDYKANRVFRYDKDANPNQNGGQKPGAETPVYNAYIKTPADSALSYLMVLPNIQFKYDISQNTLLRAAWTTGYSRPNLQDLMPTLNVNTDLLKIEMGNPGLKAAYSNNLDLLAEHYMKNVGILSGGLFYKHINRFQYLNEGVITDPSNPYYDPNATEQFLMTQPRNGKVAKVYGVEVTFNRNLTFLPSFLKNMVFTSNYTYTHSRAVTDVNRGTLRLPGQADHTANLALSYSSKKLTLQAATNFNGKFIYALGANKEQDLWVDNRWQLDLNGSFKFTKNFMFYAEAVNVLNQSAFTYMGNTSRTYDLEYTGTFVRTGLNYRF